MKKCISIKKKYISKSFPNLCYRPSLYTATKFINREPNHSLRYYSRHRTVWSADLFLQFSRYSATLSKLHCDFSRTNGCVLLVHSKHLGFYSTTMMGHNATNIISILSRLYGLCHHEYPYPFFSLCWLKRLLVCLPFLSSLLVIFFNHRFQN